MAPKKTQAKENQKAKAKTKVATTGKKATGMKKSKSTGTNARVNKISNRTKVAPGLTGLKNARYTVTVSVTSVVERYGILGQMDFGQVTLKTKPKSGSSKQGFVIYDQANVISIEGSVGGNALVRVHDTVHEVYKDVSANLSGSEYVLTDAEGAEIRIMRRSGIAVSAIAYIASTKKTG